MSCLPKPIEILEKAICMFKGEGLPEKVVRNENTSEPAFRLVHGGVTTQWVRVATVYTLARVMIEAYRMGIEPEM